MFLHTDVATSLQTTRDYVNQPWEIVVYDCQVVEGK